jgi:hypothetical protein
MPMKTSIGINILYSSQTTSAAVLLTVWTNLGHNMNAMGKFGVHERRPNLEGTYDLALRSNQPQLLFESLFETP